MHIQSLLVAFAAVQLFQTTLAAPSSTGILPRQLDDSTATLTSDDQGVNGVESPIESSSGSGNLENEDNTTPSTTTLNGEEGTTAPSQNATASRGGRSRDGGPIVINGGWEPISGDNVPARMEIGDMAANDDIGFGLYILATRTIMDRPADDPMSYLQLAGIHGAPRDKPWNNEDSKDQQFGYCHHNDEGFTTWHRPYLLAYEQALYEAIQDLVAEWSQDDPELESIKARALTWRMPYWDWANPRPDPIMIDEIGTMETIECRTPQGRQQIKNPLFSYSFPEGSQDFMGSAMELFPDSVSIRNNPGTINEILRTERVNLQNQIISLFADRDLSFADFSTKFSFENPNTFSVEYIHDLIHMHIGINGNSMASPASAAYDPIFWLHHTFVDKLTWEWQRSTGRWSDDSSLELKPFRKSENEFYTSGDVESCEALGYTYAPLGADGPTQPDNTDISERYPGLIGPVRDADGDGQEDENTEESEGDNGEGDQQTNVPRRPLTKDNLRPVIKKIVKDGKFHEYLASINIDTSAFEDQIDVYAYIGTANDTEQTQHDITNYIQDPEFVGRYTTFSWARGEGKSIRAGIPLTEALLRRVSKERLDNLLEKDAVQSYLENLFEYVVVDSKGNEVENSDGCKVEIIHYEVTLPTKKNELPTYEKPEPVYQPKPAPKEKFIYKAPVKEVQYAPEPAPEQPKPLPKPQQPPKEGSSYASPKEPECGECKEENEKPAPPAEGGDTAPPKEGGESYYPPNEGGESYPPPNESAPLAPPADIGNSNSSAESDIPLPISSASSCVPHIISVFAVTAIYVVFSL